MATNQRSILDRVLREDPRVVGVFRSLGALNDTSSKRIRRVSLWRGTPEELRGQLLAVDRGVTSVRSGALAARIVNELRERGGEYECVLSEEEWQRTAGVMDRLPFGWGLVLGMAAAGALGFGLGTIVMAGLTGGMANEKATEFLSSAYHRRRRDEWTK